MKMKNWMRSAGFTLVELIVVIAVLGILGAGAAVGYSGYVKKANKAVDQQMVTEMVHALQMSALVESDFPSDATILLSTEKAVAVGDGANAVMQSIYGSGWADACTLKYGKWALGDTVYTEAAALRAKLGDGKLSYTDYADDLWGVASDILEKLEGSDTADAVYGSSANLMKGAADYTTGIDEADASAKFASYWANGNSGFTGFGTAYISKDDGRDDSLLNSMLANAGALKARNYAFGMWLESSKYNTGDNAGKLTDVANSIKNATTGATAAGVAVPADFISLLNDSNTSGLNDENGSLMAQAINDYFGSTGVTYNNSGALNGTAGLTANPSSQAYKDGLGYFALMSATSKAHDDVKDMSNAEYRQTMADAVHNVGELLNTEASDFASLGGGCASVMVKTGADGTVEISVSPAELYLSDSQTNDTVTVTVDADQNGAISKLEKSGDLALRKGQKGTVTFVPSTELQNLLQTKNMSFANWFQFAGFSISQNDAITTNYANGVATVTVSKAATAKSISLGMGNYCTINVTIVE